MKKIVIGKNSEFYSEFKKIKDAMINEVKSWPIYNQDGSRHYEDVYTDGKYIVRMTKGGKEYFREGDKKNLHDTCVSIVDVKTGKDVPTFNKENYKIQSMCEELYLNGYEDFLRLLALMLIRAGWMFDHVDDGNGKFRYKPDDELLRLLKYECTINPGIYDIVGIDSIPILLCYIDTVATQEDVKINCTDHYEPTDQKGRYNNESGHAYFIAILLGYYGEKKLSLIANLMSHRRGCLGMPYKDAMDVANDIIEKFKLAALLLILIIRCAVKG